MNENGIEGFVGQFINSNPILAFVFGIMLGLYALGKIETWIPTPTKDEDTERYTESDLPFLRKYVEYLEREVYELTLPTAEKRLADELIQLRNEIDKLKEERTTLNAS